jgi:cell division protein FtsL
MAATALANPGTAQSWSRPRQEYYGGRRSWAGTPEVYFVKQIDNSRLVKVDDPQRKREMRTLCVGLAVLFALVMLYAWQHFSAIEYGYRIEALQTKRDNITEANRLLRLDLAELKDPERIDTLAKQMGLQAPDAGQVMRMDADPNTGAGPVMARNSDVMVISTP